LGGVMRGKTCLITGANAGIGRETTAVLAAQGARILMVCRDVHRGETARNDILARVPGAELELIQADLSTIAAVHELVLDVSRLTNRLDVLVSNAGLFSARRTTTEDGLETTFAVNHLAPFILVNGLMDLLRRSQPARVVVVASGAHYRGTMKFEDLQLSQGYGGVDAETVTVNSLHPGSVATKLLLRGLVPPWLVRRWTITPEEGARTSIYLASSENVNRVSGSYFDKCQEKKPSAEASDQTVAERLWAVSEEIIEEKASTT